MDPRTTTTARIAATVSALLAEAKITQADAADRTGIPLTTLKRRLRGASPWTTSELDAVASLLDTTVLAIVTQAEDAA